MKENTKQILKVFVCMFVALILFFGVILMCIYFAFDNSNDGVANAYSEEEIGVTNIDFTVDEGFYIKNFQNEDYNYFEQFMNYFTYFIPNVMVPSLEVSETSFYIGDLIMRYLPTGTFVALSSWFKILVSFEQSTSNFIDLDFILQGDDDYLYFVNFEYDFVTKDLSMNFGIPVTHSSSNPYNFLADFSFGPQTTGTFANQLAIAAFGSADGVGEIETLKFVSNLPSNIGCLVSPNETFANPPVVMPEGVYDDNLQDKYDDGHYEGYVEGHTSGYETGYQSGKTDGYNQGYNAGVSSQQSTIQDLEQQVEDWTYTANQYYQQTVQLQNQITTLQQDKSELQQTITTLQQDKSELQQTITTLQQDNSELQQTIDELQQTIDELQLELNRYQSAYESIGWFDVLSSSLNNVALIDIDGYKSTYVDVEVSNGADNLVNVWNLDENPGNGTAFAVVLPRYYGNGTRFRFTYRGLTGSVGGMQNVSANLGYINSTGNLITIMQLPSSIDSYVEFNISEDMNTFVIYTTGNLIVFEDFKFQIFSFDEIGIYDDGFADGRDEGIKYGEKVGYEDGYSDAREKYINNDYSFFALFSSVLDAPLQMIIGTDEKPGMLNFYIPGLDINIAPFLLSLFSVALVITIIRFILARAS